MSNPYTPSGQIVPWQVRLDNHPDVIAGASPLEIIRIRQLVMEQEITELRDALKQYNLM